MGEPDDRSEIIWNIGCEMRDAGASPAETLAVLMDSIFWRARVADGKREDPARLIGKLFADTRPAVAISDDSLSIDPADWSHRPLPEREWLVTDMIPMRKVTGLYGDGGTGKTLLLNHLMMTTALGLPFFGMRTRQGRAYVLLAENDQDDSHIILDALCRHYDVELSDLRGLMRIASRAGFDNVLLSFKNGEAIYSKLFDRLLLEIKQFEPTLVGLETAADLFGGSELDRMEVRRFVAECCGRIARETGAAVVLCAHPSVAGLKSGEGTGGSTGWNAAFRSRLFLHRVIDEKGVEADPDARVLEVKKANFARVGLTVGLRWRDGVFVLDDEQQRLKAKPSPEHAAIVAHVESEFRVGTPLSAHPQAGALWLGHWIMRTFQKKRAAAKSLIERLLLDGVLAEVAYDRHAHRKGLCTPSQAKEFRRAKETR